MTEPRPEARPGDVPIASRPVPPAPPIALVSTRGLLGAAFDLLAGSSGEMRRASFYIGSIVLGTVGPIALATWGAEVVAVDRPARDVEALVGGPVGLALSAMAVLGAIGIIVAVVESRNMAAALLGGRMSGRPVSARQALARSREIFWRSVVAAFLVGIPLGIVQFVVAAVLDPIDRGTGELSVVTTTIVTALVGAPFAYALSGVVLGAVDPVEAIGRSFRVFAARKLAAAIIVAFETVALLLIFLGLSAGLDVVVRVFAALGLGPGSGSVGLAVITGTIVAAVFAFGTLVYTVYALTVAPQVVMFVGLTHATMGLDGVRPGGAHDPDRARDDGRRSPTFTRPMLAGFGIGALALAVAVAALAD